MSAVGADGLLADDAGDEGGVLLLAAVSGGAALLESLPPPPQALSAHATSSNQGLALFMRASIALRVQAQGEQNVALCRIARYWPHKHMRLSSFHQH